MVNLHVTKSQFPSQKCHVSRTFFSQLNCCLGSPVQVRNKLGHIFLCKVYPDKTLAPDIAYAETTVRLSGMINDSFADVELLSEIKAATEVTVIVVADTIQDVIRLKKSAKVEKVLRDLLGPLLISSESSVDVSAFLPAKFFNILSVEVERTEPAAVPLFINSSTKIIFRNIVSKSWQNFHKNSGNFCLGGLTRVYKQMEDFLLFPLQTSLGILKSAAHRSLLLCGPSGCGKTSLVRKLAKQHELLLLEISSADLASSNPGEAEKNLRDYFTEAAEWSRDTPTVIFLDNVDAVASRRGSGHSHSTRVAVQLAVLLDNLLRDAESKLVVIGATDKPEAIDPVLRRPGRFDREVLISIPNQGEREEILDVVCQDLGLDIAASLHQIAQITPGYTGADLALLCREVSYVVDNGPAEFDHFKKATGKIRPSVMRQGHGVVEVTKVTWDQIGGLEQAIMYVKRSIEWPLKHPEAFARLNVPRPKGVLIYGPPGCGKSMLVRAAATSCAASFLSISAAELFSPFVGDSEKMVADVFQRARQAAPCILFLDELDAMVGGRSSAKQGHGAQLGVIAALLQEMDGISSSPSTNLPAEEQIRSQGVIVVAATNRPDKIDAALMRPGRFDSLVYIPPPDFASRLAILERVSRGMPVDQVDLNNVASRTEFFSGADLDMLCKEAALAAMECDINIGSLNNDHFETALKKVPRSLSLSQIEWYENYSSAGRNG